MFGHSLQLYGFANINSTFSNSRSYKHCHLKAKKKHTNRTLDRSGDLCVPRLSCSKPISIRRAGFVEFEAFSVRVREGDVAQEAAVETGGLAAWAQVGDVGVEDWGVADWRRIRRDGEGVGEVVGVEAGAGPVLALVTIEDACGGVCRGKQTPPLATAAKDGAPVGAFGVDYFSLVGGARPLRRR